MRISVKLAPTFSYPELERFWHDADELGFDTVWNYDHFYGLDKNETPTLEGWTTLAAMGVIVRRARVGCMVTGVTYRNPAILAKMAVTVDHITGGRMDFGIGAGWHEDEHRGYGIEFPNPGARVEMLDEALTVIRRLWTEESVTFSGRFFNLTDALCEPKPIQKPHPPIVIGGSKPKMLRLIARHADEWNMPNRRRPAEWGEVNESLDQACAEVGRNASEVGRSVQLFLHPHRSGQVDKQLELLPQYLDLGCQHAVLSFYQPPDRTLLERCAAL